jgi:hypothetical protein
MTPRHPLPYFGLPLAAETQQQIQHLMTLGLAAQQLLQLPNAPRDEPPQLTKMMSVDTGLRIDDEGRKMSLEIRPGLPRTQTTTQRKYYELFKHAREGNLPKLKDILPELDVNFRDQDGDTALHRAAAGGHVHIAQYLIMCEANIDAVNADGNTPLMVNLLSPNCNDNIVRFLMDCGADIDIRNRAQESVLNLKAGEMVKWIIRERAENPVRQVLVNNRRTLQALRINHNSRMQSLEEMFIKVDGHEKYIEKLEKQVIKLNDLLTIAQRQVIECDSSLAGLQATGQNQVLIHEIRAALARISTDMTKT